MPRPGEPLGPQKQNLNVFGQWLDTLQTVLQTSQPQLAKRAGMNMSTISVATRGKARPSLPTTQKLWSVILALAKEKKIHLPYYVEVCFFNAAGHAAPGQEEMAGLALSTFREEHIEEIGQREREKRLLQEIYGLTPKRRS